MLKKLCWIWIQAPPTGSIPFPGLRKQTPQQHLDGIHNCVDGDTSVAGLLLGGEVRYVVQFGCLMQRTEPVHRGTPGCASRPSGSDFHA